MKRKKPAYQRGKKLAQILERIEQIIKGDEVKTDPFEEIVNPKYPPPPKEEQGGA